MSGAKTADRRYQNRGYLIGVLLAAICLAVLAMPGQEDYHSAGPANTGHEEISCSGCHIAAPGTIRQQIQANLWYWLGQRDKPADLGFAEVDNAACLDCHERPDERHPVFRFFEPRFADARQAIQVHQCTSCHTEHQGVRVTLNDVEWCSNCHQDTALKNDPVDISHEQLIAAKQWDTCLGCHDFHGNHIMTSPTTVNDAIPVADILEYFDGTRSKLYSDKRYHKAKQEVSKNE